VPLSLAGASSDDPLVTAEVIGEVDKKADKQYVQISVNGALSPG